MTRRHRPPTALVPIFVASVLAASALPAPAAAELERTATEERELALEPGVRELAIENVFGSVRVRAGAPGRVKVSIRKQVKAHDREELETALREVTLEVQSRDQRLELIQDGPFRCKGASESDDCRSARRSYRVSWEWEVEAPADLDLEIATVNGGEVVVDGAGGRVHATNVNGEVRLRGVVGEVRAETVNGGVVAEYAVVPTAASRFGTVNGTVELSLPRGSGADVAFSTLHGDLYTDFEPASVAASSVTTGGDSGGRRRYRLGKDRVVGIGGGGVRLECSTVNGDVVVRSH